MGSDNLIDGLFIKESSWLYVFDRSKLDIFEGYITDGRTLNPNSLVFFIQKYNMNIDVYDLACVPFEMSYFDAQKYYGLRSSLSSFPRPICVWLPERDDEKAMDILSKMLSHKLISLQYQVNELGHMVQLIKEIKEKSDG